MRKHRHDPASGWLAEPSGSRDYDYDHCGTVAFAAIRDTTRPRLSRTDSAVALGSSATEDANVVYRGLADGEDPAGGLTARAPGTDVSPASHVAGQQASPWISTSKSLAVATEKYGAHGVVGIDLSKVSSQVVNLSGGIPGMPGMLSNWAKADQEVLIRDSVPPGAIFRP